MTLKKYQQKRDFKKTQEPSGKKKPKESPAQIFVVQKHLARNLHYDLRLELGGILKSFAVPKGPSLKKGEMRLAVAVEDHPLDYAKFSGVIPAGEYGAGKVLIWDEGNYFSVGLENGSKKENGDEIRRGFENGKMKIKFEGKKMKGEYALFKMKGRDKNWLLRKI